MKKIILFAALLSISFLAHAQVGEILKKAKEKAESKTTEKKDNSAADTTIEQANSTAGTASMKVYSKYDFVPGEKVIGFEDFSTGNIGDFPAGWNTSGSGEIVTIEGKPGRWLWITKPGVFVPEFTHKYPEDFTFEFDLLHGVPIGDAYFDFVMAELENVAEPQGWSIAPNRFTATMFISNSEQEKGTFSTEIRKNAESQAANQFATDLLSNQYNPVHIAIWRQKERVRIYCNQEKLWDIPKAIAREAKLNAMLFFAKDVDATIQYYVGNLRLAVGAPDTRNKFLTEGKWVTHGILFDVNSANIKSESYGSLKEIANVLKENADVKVKIIGHTDSDGNDASNLDLSKRRAASVKAMLAKEFGIDESRMETDGMGESKPIDKNDNPAGKANNRRVEFVKL